MLTNNITDTALIFEGGGMRGVYSAGIASVLLEKGLYFGFVAGISAGSTLVSNYISRDIPRMKKSFVDIAADPKFGGWQSFVQGKGYFNAKYIYEGFNIDEGPLPFDVKTYLENPVDFAIGAFDADHGRMHYWYRDDLDSFRDMQRVVRASSSLPMFMPPTYIDGICYVDGGLGESIALSPAMTKGYQRFFVIRSQERDYRKKEKREKPKGQGKKRVLDRKERHPRQKHIRAAMAKRPGTYNQEVAQLEGLVAEGKAYMVCPDRMPVSRSEMDLLKLEEAYAMGRAQALRDLPSWLAWLFPEEKESPFPVM